MRKYIFIYYKISLFLWLSVLVIWNIALATWEDCRKMKVEPDDLIHLWHVYTCEFNDEDNKTRLQKYCAKDNTVSTLVNATCPIVAGNTQLYCHICECTEWVRTNWRCWAPSSQTTQKKENLVTTTSEQLIVPTNTNTNQGDWSSSSEQETTTPCPSWILTSQGKCCNKTYYDLSLKATVCCEWILLSTNVPFIWQCIVYKKSTDSQPAAGTVVDENNAFPVLMGGLSRILVSIILLVSFMGILVGGVMISASGWSDEWANKGKKIIGNVISALALLGASGVILKLINPNFFW